MSELWGNGGVQRHLADHSSYSRVNLGDAIQINDRKRNYAAETANAVFVKALWREIHAIQRRRA